MGFDIKLQKGKGRSLIDLDFSVSGDAKRPDMGMGGFPGGGIPGMPAEAQGGKSLAQLPSPGQQEEEKKPSPGEVEKILSEFKKPKKNPIEEGAFKEDGIEDSGELEDSKDREESEKSREENQVWNNHKQILLLA